MGQTAASKKTTTCMLAFALAVALTPILVEGRKSLKRYSSNTKPVFKPSAKG